MEYQVRGEGKGAWMLMRVKLLPGEQNDEKKVCSRELGWITEIGSMENDGMETHEAERSGMETDETESGSAEIDEAESGEQRRKPGAKQLRKEILIYCTKPRTRKEIAAQFGFSTPDYVIQKYVLPMVRSQMMQMTIPDRPKSRNQKYFSIRMPQEE